jgi:hypothetical protein
MTRGVCQPHSRASPVVRRGAVRRGGARRGGVAAVRRVYFVFPVSTRGEGLGLGFQLVSMGSCEVGWPTDGEHGAAQPRRLPRRPQGRGQGRPYQHSLGLRQLGLAKVGCGGRRLTRAYTRRHARGRRASPRASQMRSPWSPSA